MKWTTLRAISISSGLFILSMIAMATDQITINSALLVSLIVANLGLTIKNSMDIGEIEGKMRFVENYVYEMVNERIRSDKNVR